MSLRKGQISDENISHIVMVFLFGNIKYKYPPQIIRDCSGEDWPSETWCEWPQVFKLRKPMLSSMKDIKHDGVLKVMSALKELWDAEDVGE